MARDEAMLALALHQWAERRAAIAEAVRCDDAVKWATMPDPAISSATAGRTTERRSRARRWFGGRP